MPEALCTAVLNEEQRRAADDLQNNLLVLAPAGCGKTYTLARRIVNILERGLADPENILCLTFTNRACREMAQRLESQREEARAVAVRTIHAYCYDLLREYGPLAGEGARSLTICDEEDALEVVRELAAGMRPEAAGTDGPEGGPRRKRSAAQALAGFIELCKRQMYRRRTRDCREAARAVLKEEALRVAALCEGLRWTPEEPLLTFLGRRGAAFLRAYNLRLSLDGACDFADLIARAGRLLENREAAALLHRRLLYVHVDEVQDISDIEYDLITRMARRAVFLFCGDINQTIYGWRGSEPHRILEAYRSDYAAAVIRFRERYRGGQGLVNLGERFIRRAFAGEGEVPPVSYTGEDVEIARLGDARAQARWMYERLRGLCPDGDFSNAAVLGRSNAVCEGVADAFAAYQRETGDRAVRHMLSGEFKLFRRREIRDLLAFFKCVLSERDSTSLRRIMSGYSKDAGRGALEEIARASGEAPGVTLADFACARTHRDGDYFALLTRALEEGRVVVFDVESTGVDVYKDEIIQIAAARVGPDARASQSFARFIRPRGPVGGSQAVHHFSDGFLRDNGEEPRAVLARFLDFARGSVIVGHNVGYDLSILRAELARHGLPALEAAGDYDTLDICRRFVPEADNHRLETMARVFGVENPPSHDAMDDILATAQVLAALYARFLHPGESARRLFYARHLEKFQKVSRGLEALRADARSMTAARLAEHIAGRYGVRAKYRGDAQRQENIDAFIDFLKDGVVKREDCLESLCAALEFAALSTSELDRLSGGGGRLAIITVHQAKGCEFDYVFLPSLMEYTFPNFQSVRRDDVREEKRIFYVALTRAKKKVFLSSYEQSGSGVTTQPSRFLGLL